MAAKARKKANPIVGTTTPAAPPVATGATGVEVGHCNCPSLICVQGATAEEVTVLELKVVGPASLDDGGCGAGVEDVAQGVEEVGLTQ